MFIHRKREEMAEYREIVTNGGQSLKLTDLHLIWVGDCKGGELRLAYAKDLRRTR